HQAAAELGEDVAEGTEHVRGCVSDGKQDRGRTTAELGEDVADSTQDVLSRAANREGTRCRASYHGLGNVNQGLHRPGDPKQRRPD
ncbi:MAG: hypothetical protein MUQ32_03555, partial [Chloroflexi bacterium]|nr:hypothetical protein [Chloroflexota bacterium]